MKATLRHTGQRVDVLGHGKQEGSILVRLPNGREGNAQASNVSVDPQPIIYNITRLVLARDGVEHQAGARFEKRVFNITAPSAGAAARLADEAKYNIEVERGFHKEKKGTKRNKKAA